MTPGKRLFDIALALVLLVPALPVIGGVAALILVRDGRPAIYASERMRSPDRAFTLWKFRTMAVDAGPEVGVSGGDKRHRITPIGAVLRRTRLDELPQLFNVLRGDMSFVGPRPPTRHYVERFPELYARVLRCRPGITGLATVMYHSHEEWLLRDTATAAETDAVYCRRCVPWKAHLDLIYQRHRSMALDLYLLYLTAGKLLPLPGARLSRLKAKARRV
mgnify:CR=1 FL=1